LEGESREVDALVGILDLTNQFVKHFLRMALQDLGSGPHQLVLFIATINQASHSSGVKTFNLAFLDQAETFLEHLSNLVEGLEIATLHFFDLGQEALQEICELAIQESLVMLLAPILENLEEFFEVFVAVLE
jgi:hypothetical protein